MSASTQLPTDWAQHGVDPARLTHGTYSHDSDEEIGEGDIVGSYSADRISEGNSLRKPFRWRDQEWVVVAIQGRATDAQVAKAYRLMPVSVFAGTPTTYPAKVAIDNGDFARHDPLGFYHGMTVQSGPQTFVLCGPPAWFTPDESQRAAEQLGLF